MSNKEIKDMNEGELGVLVSTWAWRIKKAGYRTQKDFCDAHGLSEPTFSLWINGKQQPRIQNIEMVEGFLKETGE